jgi:hypothetical protein
MGTSGFVGGAVGPGGGRGSDSGPFPPQAS